MPRRGRGGGRAHRHRSRSWEPPPQSLRDSSPAGGAFEDQALPSQPLPLRKPARNPHFPSPPAPRGEMPQPAPAQAGGRGGLDARPHHIAEAPHRRLVTPPPARQREPLKIRLVRRIGRANDAGAQRSSARQTGLLKDRTRGFKAPGRPRRQDRASEKPRPVAITSGIPTRFPRLGGPQRRGDARAVRSRFDKKASRGVDNGWRPAKRESPSVAYGVSCRVRHEEVCREACASFTPFVVRLPAPTWVAGGRPTGLGPPFPSDVSLRGFGPHIQLCCHLSAMGAGCHLPLRLAAERE